MRLDRSHDDVCDINLHVGCKLTKGLALPQFPLDCLLRGIFRISSPVIYDVRCSSRLTNFSDSANRYI